MIRLLAVWIVIAALVGCRDGPASPYAGTTYVLERIDGAAMPVARFASAQFTETVLADTIQLLAPFRRSRWVTYTRRQMPLADPPADEIDRAERNYPYEVRRDTLRFRYVCRDTGDCLAPPWGTFSSGGAMLTVRTDAITHVSVREYRRIE